MEDSHTKVDRSGQQGAGLSGTDIPLKPRCAAIIAASPARRVAGLKAAAAAMMKEGAALVRVGNPLNSPLTLHRILIQIGLDGQDANGGEDDDARLLQLLTNQGTQGRTVLEVEQAETLDPAALLSLQRLASTPGSVVVLFIGAPTFWALLDGTGLAPLRQALAGQRTQPADAPLAAVIPPLMPSVPLAAHVSPNPSVGPAPEFLPATPAQSGRRWWIAGAVGLVTTVILGTAAVLAPGGLFYYSTPHRQAAAPPDITAVQQTPVMPQAAPPVPVTAAIVGLPAAPGSQVAPSTPHAPAPSPSAARAETPQTYLRSGPAQSWDVPGHSADVPTDAQRNSRSGQLPAWQLPGMLPSAAPSSPGGRVVIHYRDGSATGGAEADRLATAAAPFADKVQTRAVADTPSAPVIRFFHAEDAARARQLAWALRGSRPGWDIKDFSSFRPSPSTGTIEVWTPTH